MKLVYPSGNGYEARITYGIKHSFKDIVKLFSTSGAMTPALMNLLSVDSVSQLKLDQASDHMLRQASDEAVLTIVGIKILNQFFASDRKLWALVERKARKYIMSASMLDKADLDAALESVQTKYDEYKPANK